jgi:hypothetical protein
VEAVSKFLPPLKMQHQHICREAGYYYSGARGQYIDVITGKPIDYQTAQAWAIERTVSNGEFYKRFTGKAAQAFVAVTLLGYDVVNVKSSRLPGGGYIADPNGSHTVSRIANYNTGDFFVVLDWGKGEGDEGAQEALNPTEAFFLGSRFSWHVAHIKRYL